MDRDNVYYTSQVNCTSF